MFLKYLLNTYYVPDTILGAKDAAVKKVTAFIGLTFSWGETGNKHKQTHSAYQGPQPSSVNGQTVNVLGFRGLMSLLRLLNFVIVVKNQP